MTEPLTWKKVGFSYYAADYPLKYRITPSANNGWRVYMDGTKIGETYKSLEAAINYVEHGGRPPRQSREQA